MGPKKGQKMDLGAFLSHDGGSWNDDIDLPTAPATNSFADYGSLPTGPNRDQFERSGGHSYGNGERGFESGRSQGQPFDQASVPFDPPFTAFMGNLSYNVTEHDLETFFGTEIKIKNVRFIMDLNTNKPKGYGYIEFLDRDSLIAAVQMDGESLQKRSVRINVAEQKVRPGREGRPDDSKFQGNWRSKAAEQPPRQNNSFGGRRDAPGDRPHTGGWASGFRKEREESRPFQRREPAATSPIVPSKPKENPFGNAAPRDEEAIQRQIEERRLAREKEREKEEKDKKDKKDKERIAAAEAALEKAKLSDRTDSKKEPVDNIPTGAGSWRRTQGAKPAGSQQKPPSFRKKSNFEKGSITSIPGEAGSTGFTKTAKKDGKFTNSKKEPLRKDEKSGAPLKSDVKSPTNSFDLLAED